MSSYYPIPNDILISKKENIYIKSSIKVFNYPNNARYKLLKNINKKDIFFSLYILEKNAWVKIFDKKCEFGENYEFVKENLDLDKNEFAVVIPSENKLNPKKTNILPKPYSLRIDKSPINERAAYNFQLDNVSTTYQGEFPYELTLTGKSFFSTDILRSDFEKNSKTYILLMNLNKSSQENNFHEFDIFDFKENKLIKKYFVKSNSFESYLLPKNSLSYNHSNLLLTCKTASFIPIFISFRIDNEIREICAEHTHPPHELFLGVERFKIISKIRNNWLR